MARFTVEWRRIVGYATVAFMIDYALWSIAPLGLYPVLTLLAANIWWEVYGLSEEDFPFKDATSIMNVVGGVLLNPQQRVDVTNYLKALYKTAGWTLVVVVKGYQVVHDALSPEMQSTVAILSTMVATLTLAVIHNLVTSLIPIRVLVDIFTDKGDGLVGGAGGDAPDDDGGAPGQPTPPSAPTRTQPAPAAPPLNDMISCLFGMVTPLIEQQRRANTAVAPQPDSDDEDESATRSRRRRKGYDVPVRRRVVKVTADVDDELDAVLEEMD